MSLDVEFRRCIYVLGIALADVITYIEETISYSEELIIPVFQFKDLTELYKKQMILHGVATKDTKYIHSTRLKNQILENVPCLCETKKEKFTLLTLNSEMGRALLEECQSYSHNDGMIIAKATSVIRKQLLNKDEIFNRDLSREQQMASILQVLDQLIQLLLEGEICNSNNYSTCSSNITNIISHSFGITLLNIKGEIQLLMWDILAVTSHRCQ